MEQELVVTGRSWTVVGTNFLVDINEQQLDTGGSS
jgi:hypothetical protein